MRQTLPGVRQTLPGVAQTAPGVTQTAPGGALPISNFQLSLIASWSEPFFMKHVFFRRDYRIFFYKDFPRLGSFCIFGVSNTLSKRIQTYPNVPICTPSVPSGKMRKCFLGKNIGMQEYRNTRIGNLLFSFYCLHKSPLYFYPGIIRLKNIIVKKKVRNILNIILTTDYTDFMDFG